VWATLIGGAKGVMFFDHRFGSDFVTQDFAAMLHDPAMKAMVTALSARVQSLGPALLAPEANLVTATTSSNTTSGPIGGTYGVPLHYTTRVGGGHEYLFAMGIRPGATTATFTIPTWAGQTVTVIDENRTVTVSGAGVLTDTFAADYTTHLYQGSASVVVPLDPDIDGGGVINTTRTDIDGGGPTGTGRTDLDGGTP
jgi:hypothetical protein